MRLNSSLRTRRFSIFIISLCLALLISVGVFAVRGQAGSAAMTSVAGTGVTPLAGQQSSSDTFEPIIVTGFNQDVVADGYTVASSTTATMDGGTARTGNTFYARGYSNSWGISNLAIVVQTGLPMGMMVVSETDPNKSYQLWFSYTNNALMLDSSTTKGTLKLTEPAAYSQLSLLTTSAKGASTLTLTLHFADGAPDVSGLTVNVPDWFDGTPVAFTANGRVTAPDTFNSVGSGNPRLYDESVTLPQNATMHQLSSIDFSWSGSNPSSRAAVFALSGVISPTAPAPPGIVPPPPTKTLVVNTTADRNDGSCDALGTGTGNKDCTLRDAITVANSLVNEVVNITFKIPKDGSDAGYDSATGVFTIELTLGELLMSRSMSITGLGAKNLIVKRGQYAAHFRVFETQASAITVFISGMTIRDGRAPDGTGNNPGGDGGAILNRATATLNLKNVAVSGSTAGTRGSVNATNGNGGGIMNLGTLTLTNSTVSGNTASGAIGGGIYNSGTMTLTNTTVSGNAATSTGGGIYNAAGRLSLVNTTISNNTLSTSLIFNAPPGPGLRVVDGVVTIKNSLFAGNITGRGFHGSVDPNDIDGPVISQDYNFIAYAYGAVITGTTTHNIINTDANLGALTDNGGQTQTVLPLPGSLAVNAVDVARLPPDTFDADDDGDTSEPLPVDQRGFPRVVGPFFDIGAAEANFPGTETAVAFSSSSYTVSEGDPAGAVTITVNRSGDTSSAVSVDYATSDTGGPYSCTQKTGQASERCDYATTLGTLRWAPGEGGAKTFTVPIVNDTLVEGNETFNVTLSNLSGAIFSSPFQAAVTIRDDDNDPSAQNPIDDPSFFIREQYIDFLGRRPDPVGFQNWLATLQNCPNGGFGLQNPTCDRLKIALSTFQSEEFQTRGYWVYRFYEVALARRPNYAEFTHNMALIGGPRSPADGEVAKQQFVSAFVQSTEFVNKYGSLRNDQLYIDTLLLTAGLSNLSISSQLVSQLQSGQISREQALRQIVETKDAEDKFYNRGLVSMMYFGFMRRAPDDTGFNNYINNINASGDWTDKVRHMVFDFIYSNEYRGRFGKP